MNLANPPILDIQGLTVAYRQGDVWADALREFDLQIYPGQTYGLVGESGSGKTTVALAVMRYLAENARVQAGKIRFDGRDLLELDQAEQRRIWGAQISLVPQNPLTALNPSLRIGTQLEEGLRQYFGLDRTMAVERALALLRRVRFTDVKRIAGSYPHQISGGMQQRVMIAMALSANPRLLILDEPTTNLDVTTQAAILDLLRDLIAETKVAVLYVTHNLGVVAQICSRVAVLYAGELVEDGSIEDLFENPRHPYTRAMLASQPLLGVRKTSRALQSIPGRIPAIGERPAGCVFAPRCGLVSELCKTRPLMDLTDPEHLTRCHHWQELQAGSDDHTGPAPVSRERSLPPMESSPILDIQDLQVHYSRKRSENNATDHQADNWLRAVDHISLSIRGSMTLGLVGESGSGKTTVARAVMGLVEPAGGEIKLLEMALPAQLDKRSLETLRKLQMVFQNPEDSLNPYLTVGETLTRPLRNSLGLSKNEARLKALDLLQSVQLPSDFYGRMPDQLSGGEKQRVAIARAFATNPHLLVADEPVSSLDVSVQASILNLLNDIQAEHGTAMLFISHDLAVVAYLADTIAVIYQGRLMEVGSAEAIFHLPQHPYTEVLLDSLPMPDPRRKQRAAPPIDQQGEALGSPAGCPFAWRCPRSLGEVCLTQIPAMQTASPHKVYFCHITPAELERIQEVAPAHAGILPPSQAGFG